MHLCMDRQRIEKRISHQLYDDLRTSMSRLAAVNSEGPDCERDIYV